MKVNEFNYSNYNSNEFPYFNFSYVLLKKNENFKTYEGLKFNDNKNGYDNLLRIRIDIDSFKGFTNFILNQSKLYSSYNIKSKTFTDDTTDFQFNCLNCIFEEEGLVTATSNFKIQIPHKQVLIGNHIGYMYDLLVRAIFNNSFIEIREMAGLLSKRVNNFNYKPDNCFIIIKVSEVNGRNGGYALELKFCFNTKVYRSVISNDGHIISPKTSFEKMFYKIQLATFIRISKTKASFKDSCLMLFKSNSIILYSTKSCDSKSKNIYDDIYSFTTLKLNTELIHDEKEVRKVLEENDTNIMF